MSFDLRQSTARYINIGPFVDVSDAATNETGLAGSMTVKLAKYGGALGARNSSTAISYDADGFYRVHLDATDTNTAGDLVVSVSAPATHLHVVYSYKVLPANVFDSLYSSDKLQVDVTQCAGSAVSGVADFKATGSGLTFDYTTDTVTLAAATHTGAVIPTVTTVTNGLTPGNVTVGGFTQAALAEMVTDDTGETVAAAGSVAKIAQGSAGGNVTVGAMTTAALAQFATDDTGETVAVAGSVAKLADATSNTGSGAIEEVITISDALSNPLDGVEVWITTDVAGTNVVAGTLTTNASGQATFMLDAGTYYVWMQRTSYNFDNPQTLVVS